MVELGASCCISEANGLVDDRSAVGATRLFAESDIGQFNPTLKADSHLIAGSPIVWRTRLEGEFVLIVRVASPAFDERFVVRTVHPYMMLVQPLGFDTVQSVNNFRLKPQLS